jgi:hypothetical protein
MNVDLSRARGAACPHCKESAPVLLAAISEMSDFYYYGCPKCRQVWTEPKSPSATERRSGGQGEAKTGAQSS